MTRNRPAWVPDGLETLDQIEEWAHDAGIDYFDVLWAWSGSDIHGLAQRSGTTVEELVQRMIAAGRPIDVALLEQHDARPSA